MCALDFIDDKLRAVAGVEIDLDLGDAKPIPRPASSLTTPAVNVAAPCRAKSSPLWMARCEIAIGRSRILPHLTVTQCHRRHLATLNNQVECLFIKRNQAQSSVIKRNQAAQKNHHLVGAGRFRMS